jgi:small multidrug resistance family-3 protein
MFLAKSLGLFMLTAVAEIVGCYLPYLWLKKAGSAWLLVPAALSLALFVWLLTLLRPTPWDIVGVAVALIGMGIIMSAPARGS